MKNHNVNKSVLLTGANRKWLVIPSLLIAATALIMTILPSFAQQASLFRVPFDEIVGPSGGPGTCPQVNWPLHLLGVSHMVVHDTVANGIHHLTVEHGVQGGATDAAGNTFVFAYENHVTDIYITDPSQPIRVTVTDHFNLEGQIGHVRQNFVVLLTMDASGNLVVDFKPNGPTECDPI